MNVRRRAAMLCVVALTGAWALDSAWAAKRACAAGTTQVKGFGCVRDAEIRKAKKNCAAQSSRADDFKHCLCQDGRLIGACGD